MHPLIIYYWDLVTENLSNVGEQVMGKLVDIVLFLNQEINHSFGNPGTSSTSTFMLVKWLQIFFLLM